MDAGGSALPAPEIARPPSCGTSTAGYLGATRMDLFDGILATALAALVIFQIWLTVRVWKSRLFERKQKILQAQLIWLLPVLGAGLVFTILQEEERSTDKTPPSALS
jgi:hypothetical protein